MKLNDRVEKVDGYRWPGKVVALFNTTQGKTRVVVECTAIGAEGALHIYDPKQLRVIQEAGRAVDQHKA